MKTIRSALLVAALSAGLSATNRAAEPSAPTPSPVPFAKHKIGSLRSEAVAVADFNGDGRLDIVAGAYLYLAPDWKPVQIRKLDGAVDGQGKGYFDDFVNLPLDVDGDGKLDVVSCGWFCKCLRWNRNTLGAEGLWPESIADTHGNFETAELVDIDGDGQASEILANTSDTLWYERAPSGFIRHTISPKPMNFGGGVGDLNGDGRPDVLRPDAWFEAPENPRTGQWIEHAWALGAKEGKAEHTPQMIVYDVNGDDLPDVITSSAHKHGIFWYAQVRQGDKISWKQHLIDDSWSQAHNLALADIDGDGTPDLVTGKRFMAHNGGDPDAFGKLGVYWYKLRRSAEPQWTKYAISFDDGVGAGINICAIDIDQDGDIDVVTTGKWGGPVLFENKLK